MDELKEVKGKDLGPSAKRSGEPKTALKVGDRVRVLPLIRNFRLNDYDNPQYPGVIQPMLDLIGREIEVEAVELVGWGIGIQASYWYWHPEWLELVTPEPVPGLPEALPKGTALVTPSKEFLFAFNEGMKYQAGISMYQNEQEAWDAFQKEAPNAAA